MAYNQHKNTLKFKRQKARYLEGPLVYRFGALLGAPADCLGHRAPHLTVSLNGADEAEERRI